MAIARGPPPKVALGYREARKCRAAHLNCNPLSSEPIRGAHERGAGPNPRTPPRAAATLPRATSPPSPIPAADGHGIGRRQQACRPSSRRAAARGVRRPPTQCLGPPLAQHIDDDADGAPMSVARLCPCRGTTPSSSVVGNRTDVGHRSRRNRHNIELLRL
jgi:hypothetical protein